MQSTYDRQRKALFNHKKQKGQFEKELVQYKRGVAQWQKSGDNRDPPVEPVEPLPVEYWTDNATTEAMAILLRDNWRGMLLVKDELAGWFGDLDRYSSGKGGDVARWLKWHGGRPDKYNRKTGERIVHIPYAAVSITGNIPPDTLRRHLGPEHHENGLAARFLLAMPPRRTKEWTEAEIDVELEERVGKLLDCLFQLQPEIGDEEEPRPKMIDLTPEGKREWVAFHDQHAQEEAELADDLSAAWSKLEGYAARLALVIHMTRWASFDPRLQTADAVDAESIAAGVRLSRWFGHEAKRVYAMLSESDDDRNQRRLIEWIERQDRPVTAREVQQHTRRIKTSHVAESELQRLVTAGYGHWESTPRGQRGQPTRRFILSSLSTAYGNTPNPEETDNTVDGLDASEKTFDDEWGEL